MKKFVFFILGCILLLSLVACDKILVADDDSPFSDDVVAIGVLLPNKSSDRWLSDGTNIKKQLETEGYKVELKYADDDASIQVEQARKLIARGIKCLVIAPIDSGAFVDIGVKAKEASIPVISYDNLIMNTDAVSYYVAYDSKSEGIKIGEYIKDKLTLDTPKRQYTIELFMGPANDNNALMIYNGCMEVLRPYFDNGTLICKTGKISFGDSCISNWSEEIAREWCTVYLENYYAIERLDICVTACDNFAYACKSVFEGAGYKAESDFPLITGIGAEPTAIKNIMSGTQAMTIFRDTSRLVAKCVDIVDLVLKGDILEVNDTEYYDNGMKMVPSYIFEPVVVDSDNCESVLEVIAKVY